MHSQASISYIGNFNVLSYQEETSIFCERPEGTKGCCRCWHSLFRAAHRQLFPCLAFHSRKSRSTGLGLDQSFKDDIARFEPAAVCRGAFLWFFAVVRNRLGALEDRFFSTVFLGSGLLYVAMIFISAALAGGLIRVLINVPDILM